jgi:hypothetical protein
MRPTPLAAAGPRVRMAARVALALATAGLMACNGHTPDRAASAARDAKNDATSARFAHPPPFEAPSKVPGRTASGPEREEVARLEKKVARLEQDVAVLRAEVASGGASQPAGATAVLDRTQLAATEAAFRGEAMDPAWSAKMTEDVRAGLARGAIDHDAARSVECRSRSCRVELAARASGAAPQEIAPLLARLVPALPHAQAGEVDNADGRPTTVLYLSR